MNKSKKPKNKIVKYLREVSVVVIGVAITLSASYFITRSSENRDMYLYLNAIKMELEENIKVLDENAKNFLPSVKYANYLQSNEKAALNADSILSYKYVYYRYFPYTYKNNAFDMFKNSGTMRLLKDRELLLVIWDVYSDLSYIKNMLDIYNELKMGDIKKELEWSDIERQKNIPMYNFYRTDAPYNMMDLCNIGSNGIKVVLLKLDKSLKIKKIPKKNE